MHGLHSSAHAIRMHRAARACQVARCAHIDWPQGHLHISMPLAPSSNPLQRRGKWCVVELKPYNREHTAIKGV